MIDIRHRLNDHLLAVGGHIGYSVRKSCRGHGYVAEMLRLALLVCRRLGIERALVTCSDDNIASVKTILKNGGVLEDVRSSDGHRVRRYWIAVPGGGEHRRIARPTPYRPHRQGSRTAAQQKDKPDDSAPA